MDFIIHNILKFRRALVTHKNDPSNELLEKHTCDAVRNWLTIRTQLIVSLDQRH